MVASFALYTTRLAVLTLSFIHLIKPDSSSLTVEQLGICEVIDNCPTSPISGGGGGGGGLEYKKGGGAGRLAQGCKFQILVSLRVLRKNHQYF